MGEDEEDKLDSILVKMTEIEGDIKYIKGNLGVLNKIAFGIGGVTGTAIILAILALII